MAEFEPATIYEAWLVRRLALYSVRLDRSAEQGVADMRRGILRAVRAWDLDRRHEADQLGNRLGKDPERVARGLRRTKHGADWLIERWEGLQRSIDTKGCWNEDQRSLAFDLLGVARILRDGHDQVPEATDREKLDRLVKGQIAFLRHEQAVSLNALDAHERDLATHGMPLTEDAETRRLRRDETNARRDFRWTHAELLRLRSGREPRPTKSNRKPNSNLNLNLNPNDLAGPWAAADEPPPRNCVPRAGIDYVINRVERNVDQMFEDVFARMTDEADGIDREELDQFEARETPSVAVPQPAPSLAPRSAPAFTPSRTPSRPGTGNEPSGNRRQRRAAKLKERRDARRSAGQSPGR